MKYYNDEIRRRDKLMDETSARALLKSAEYGTLAMVEEDGSPYAIPVNYVWDERNRLYIHCATEGRKLRALAAHAEVCFSVVGRVRLQPAALTCEYESVVLRGRAHVCCDEAERWEALMLLLDKLAPEYKEKSIERTVKSLPRVAILCIEIAEFSGKRKAMPAVNEARS